MHTMTDADLLAIYPSRILAPSDSKYYWVCAACLEPRKYSPAIIHKVTKEHPFMWLDEYNTGDPENLHDACRDQYILLNWKEITGEEYNLFDSNLMP